MPQLLPDPELPSFRRAPGYNPALRKDDRLKTKVHGRENIQLAGKTLTCGIWNSLLIRNRLPPSPLCWLWLKKISLTDKPL